MDEIRKPKRTAGKIVRSRNKGIDDNKCKNTQGLKEECDPKYARIVSFQRAVGIRRAELARLLGVDLSHRNDEWYVIVQRGKGGKQQRQYILPENVDTVQMCSVRRNSIIRLIFMAYVPKTQEDATHIM